MSSDEKGGLEPELPRKNVVGLFCGAVALFNVIQHHASTKVW